MPLLNLPERTITATTAAGPITLTYYYSPATSATKPTLFLLHGFPDTVSTFNSCASHLISHGYGILAPNPLGYGTSDRPVPTSKSDVSTLRKFASKHQGDSFIAIIDKELGEDKKVVVMGHDWGSYLVGKFALLYPERVAGVVLGNIAFFQPTETMDLDMYNKMLLQMSKVEHSGYIKFFAEFEHASDLIKKNPESFVSLLYAADTDVWKEDMVPTGKAEAWIVAGRTTKIGEWVPKETIEGLYKRIEEDGLKSALCMYTATALNLHWGEGEKDIPKESWILQPPCLMIGARRDWCSPWMFIENMKNTCKDVVIKEVDSGHWTLYEREKEWNDLVLGWLEEKGF